ncbi:MAG: alpha/beta hydrolase [Micromonosporaceae bacterium]
MSMSRAWPAEAWPARPWRAAAGRLDGTSPVELAIARVLWRLPPHWRLRLIGQRPVCVDGQILDPELQMMLAVRDRRRLPAFADTPVAQLRARTVADARLAGGVPARVGSVRSLTVPGAEGPLAARHYAPPSAGSGPGRAPSAGRSGAARFTGRLPLVLFFHGGGFVFGDLDTHDALCRLLCRHANVHVVSVAYRLAPEHPFPAPIEDAWAAWQWASGSGAALLGADVVAVAGDSAGGLLSAVVSRLATHADDVAAPALQLLFYPPIDRLGTYRSRDLFGTGFFLTVDEVDFFHAQYFGELAEDPADARRHPLAAADLSGLPPALVVTGGFDPLRDEGEAYAAALGAAGVRVTVRRFPGMVHGFANMVGLSQAARAAVIDVAVQAGALLRRLALARASSASPEPSHAEPDTAASP